MQASYVHDLAAHFQDGRLTDDAIQGVLLFRQQAAALSQSLTEARTCAGMSDEELMVQLTQVKGIGTLWLKIALPAVA